MTIEKFICNENETNDASKDFAFVLHFNFILLSSTKFFRYIEFYDLLDNSEDSSINSSAPPPYQA